MLLVSGPNILEIEVEPKTKPTSSAKVLPQRSFNDPAILSYAKPDETKEKALQGGRIERKPMTLQSKAPSSVHTIPTRFLPKASVASISTSTSTSTQDRNNDAASYPSNPKENITAATLNAPFNDISLNGHGRSSDFNTQDLHVQDHSQRQEPKEPALAPIPKTKGKRGGKATAREGTTYTTKQTPTLVKVDLATTSVSGQQRRSNNKKGWRQTPLLEEPAAPKVRLPRTHGEPIRPDSGFTRGQATSQNRLAPEFGKGRIRRQVQEDDQNGWATGEATDIQDMGEFDFAENHKKFDKRKVFDQIKKDDTTADEARLVSFNRLPSTRPGTGGGKNLHYTENVLDSPINKNVDHSSGDSDLAMGARSLSQVSARRNLPSRKGSALAKASYDRIASPKLKTDSSASQRKASIGSPKPSLITIASGNLCPCISPIQMLELEQLAITELDLTEDMMTENAARGIAQAAFGLASGDLPQKSKSTLIVILAGNNKTGSRAIAAGRHLRNHGTRVVLCVLGLEREDDLIDSVRRQLKIFRNCSGQAVKQDALIRTLRKLPSTTNVIIDALLGMHVSFDDLRTDDQAAYFQLVCWALGSDAEVLALDVPSGIDASTGKQSSLSLFGYSRTHPQRGHLPLTLPTGASASQESTSLVITSQHVLSLGAPKIGLLSALSDMQSSQRPNLAVADIGIGPVAWQKFGTRRKHGVDFAGSWVAELEFREGIGA